MMEQGAYEAVTVKTDRYDNPPKEKSNDSKAQHFFKCPRKRHYVAIAARKI